jgi:hypothetical protein
MTDTKPRISIEVTADERRQMRLAAATLDLSLTAFVKHRALNVAPPTPETISAAVDVLIAAFRATGSPTSVISDKKNDTAVIVCIGPQPIRVADFIKENITQ